MLAVARTLGRTHDNKSATAVLSQWLDEGFGDPAVVREGKLELATQYRLGNQIGKSIPLFRDVVAAFDSPYDDRANGKIVAAVELASQPMNRKILRRRRNSSC